MEMPTSSNMYISVVDVFDCSVFCMPLGNTLVRGGFGPIQRGELTAVVLYTPNCDRFFYM